MSSTSNGRWLVWPLSVGTAVALAFSNGCSSSTKSSHAAGDGGSSDGRTGESGDGSSGGSSDGGKGADSTTGSDSGGSSGSDSGSSTVGDSASSGSSDSASTGSSDSASAGSNDTGSTSGSDTGSTVTDGGVGGVPGGQAGPGVTVKGCEIFPPDNPWNTMIDGVDVVLNHAYDANIPQGTALHADFGGFTTQGYGIPYSVVPATQAFQDVDFSLYASESDPGPNGWIGTNPVMAGAADGETMYPFFTGMHVEGNPPAGGTPGSLGGDQHALVVVQGSGGCKLYEAWQCVAGGMPPFQCGNGAVWNLTSNGLRTLGWTSADAAGLPIFAGLVRLAEVQGGAINHAIRVTFDKIAFDYILPASHAAGKGALPDPPMGLRLRLKSSVNISSYTVESQVIMTAMKKYGLIIADIGSDWYFSGDSNDGWLNMAKDGKDKIIYEVSGDFGKLHGSDFEAIESGKAQSTGL